MRRNIPYFTERSYDLVLILSGDQLYRMNFQDMIRTHMENKAVVTIAALPVAEEEARSCGIMRIQADGRVIDFEEKPKTQEKLSRVRTDPNWLDKLGLKAHGRPYLASMGIYLFNAKALVELLESSDATDFGHELLPQTIINHRVQAFLFDGYWEDIGTVGAFHQANIDLTRDAPSFDFTFGEQPIYTRARYLPCSRISGATLRNCLICDGCIIGKGSVIENSVIGVRSIIGENSTIRDSYLMGCDLLRASPGKRGKPAAGSTRNGRRGRLGRGTGHRRQERPDRPQREDRQRDRNRGLRGDDHPRDSRRDHRHSQADDPARWNRHMTIREPNRLVSRENPLS